MIKRIHHIGFAFDNIEEKLKILSDLLGFQPVDTLIDSNGAFRSCVTCINEVALEFLEPVGSSGPIQKFLQEKGGGFHHLSLEVDDIDRTKETLKRRGIQMIPAEPEVVGKSKVLFIHPRFTGGLMIELLERIP